MPPNHDSAHEPVEGDDTRPSERLLDHVLVDAVPASEVAPGITRRDLLRGEVDATVFDMLPGVGWPVVDHHDRDEFIYVVSGELIEGTQRYDAGSYLHYQVGSSHQPRTETGVRILVLEAATVPTAAVQS